MRRRIRGGLRRGGESETEKKQKYVDEEEEETKREKIKHAVWLEKRNNKRETRIKESGRKSRTNWQKNGEGEGKFC